MNSEDKRDPQTYAIIGYISLSHGADLTHPPDLRYDSPALNPQWSEFHMKVLLTRDVEKLGKAGTVKTVADGYARNYLIPHGLAVFASPGALKQAETIRKAEEKRQTQLATEASSLADKLSGVTLKFQARAGEGGKLYGSITAKQVIDALEREVGQAIDKRKLDLREPIRSLGLHTVRAHLATDVSPAFNVLVERDTSVAAEAAAVEFESAAVADAVEVEPENVAE